MSFPPSPAPLARPCGTSALPLDTARKRKASPLHTCATGLFRFLRFFRLLRLLRLLKISHYLNLVEEAFNINLRFLRVVQMVVQMLFIAHLLGCFWCGASR